MVNHVLTDWQVFRETTLLEDVFKGPNKPEHLTRFLEAVRALGLSPQGWLLGVGKVPQTSRTRWKAGFQFDKLDPRAPSLRCLEIAYYPSGEGESMVLAILQCMDRFVQNLRYDYVALHRERRMLEERLSAVRHILPILGAVPGIQGDPTFPGYASPED